MSRLLRVILVSVVAIHLHTEQARGGPIFMGLGDLAGGDFYSVSPAISAGGSAVVGLSKSATGIEAFRWTSSGGMVGLGDLSGGSFFSLAKDVSGGRSSS